MSTAAQKGHPAGLYVLFFTEMWERFSYYGMRAIFFLYLTNALLMNTEDASNVYGSYTGLVYLTPLLGGYIADKYWGNRRSIFVGGILMAIGQFIMFASGSVLSQESSMDTNLMLAGLFFLILGNGFFKPNISTMVGHLYPEGDRRIDSAFTIFYMGINLGAFFSPLVCGGLGDTGNIGDFKWGFLAAGIGMVISVISFELLKNRYLVRPDGSPVGMPASHVHNPTRADQREANYSSDSAVNRLNAPDLAPKKETPNFGTNQIMLGAGIAIAAIAAFYFLADLDFIGSLIFGAAVGVPALIITDASLTSIEKQRIWVIFILAFFVIFFWSAFEQAGASLTYFADKQTDRFLTKGYEVPASYFQSINPLGIIVLAPLFSWLWVRLGDRGAEPSSPLKMALGLLLVCLGYVVIAFAVKDADASIRVSMWWLFALYVLHTMGELCLSPIGLSMVSKLAPLRFASLLMGTWFLANAAANKLAGTLSALIPPDAGQFVRASENGIDLQGVLNGTVTTDPTMLEKIKELGLTAQYPTLLGNQITNLYEFFMIFIIMSGVAAVILFVLHRWLKKLMHGVN